MRAASYDQAKGFTMISSAPASRPLTGSSTEPARREQDPALPASGSAPGASNRRQGRREDSDPAESDRKGSYRRTWRFALRCSRVVRRSVPAAAGSGGIPPKTCRLQQEGASRENGYTVLVVSNQSCVGRGLLSWEELQAITRRMLLEVALSGGAIEKVLLLPARARRRLQLPQAAAGAAAEGDGRTPGVAGANLHGGRFGKRHGGGGARWLPQPAGAAQRILAAQGGGESDEECRQRLRGSGDSDHAP